MVDILGFLRRVLGEPGQPTYYEGGSGPGDPAFDPHPYTLPPNTRSAAQPSARPAPFVTDARGRIPGQLPAGVAVPLEAVETSPLAPPPSTSVPVPYLPPLFRKDGTEIKPRPIFPQELTMPAPKLIDPIKLVDWSFVKGLEGNKRTGYVPRDPDKGKQAGVTIGAGVDLGQMSPRDLKNLGLPKELESKLTPYVSLVGDAAKSTLKKKPLSLSEIEAAQVTDARKRFGVNRLGSKLATAGVDFSTLPPEVATAVTSLGWHLGEDLPNAAPRFTEKLAKAQKTGDFAPVVLELRNFGKDHKYMTRRKKEADLIESFIKKNKT